MSLQASLPSLGELDRLIATKKAQAETDRVSRDADAIRARCKTLAGFIREAWHVIEPGTKYVHNWHIDVICRHLEAVSDGRITRLLINEPPGSMKSLLVSVLWQAWEWGPGGKPWTRWLATSYNDKPVTRDTRKARDLIASAWYQALWPHVVLVRTGETSFANSATGTREGVAFGSLTSQRGDRVLIDDPHSTETAESDADRKSTTRKFRERAIFSVNDAEKSAIVVIMQRLHEDDISGIILKYGMNFQHIMLPMEFEVGRSSATVLGPCDPRSSDGELLDPLRTPPAAVVALKRDIGSHAYAGQFQQRPTAREGGMFKVAWFAERVIPIASVPPLTRIIRHWDLAATKKATAARTAGVKMGVAQDGRIFVLHVALTQDEGNVVRDLIKAVAATDGPMIEISLPQDPGQAGKVQAQDMLKMLSGYTAHAEIESGEKATRAAPFAAQCEAGNVWVVADNWTQGYLDELALFPGATFKDQVDASSGAFGRLTLGNAGFANFMQYLANQANIPPPIDRLEKSDADIMHRAPVPEEPKSNDLIEAYRAKRRSIEHPVKGCAHCGLPVVGARVTDGVSQWHRSCV